MSETACDEEVVKLGHESMLRDPEGNNQSPDNRRAEHNVHVHDFNSVAKNRRWLDTLQFK